MQPKKMEPRRKKNRNMPAKITLSSPRLWRGECAPQLGRASAPASDSTGPGGQQIDPPAAPGERRSSSAPAGARRPIWRIHSRRSYRASFAADQVLIHRVHVVVRRRHGFHLQAGFENHVGSAAGRSCRRRVVRSSRPLPSRIELGLHHVVLLEQARRQQAGPVAAHGICMGCSFTSLRTPWIWPSATT